MLEQEIWIILLTSAKNCGICIPLLKKQWHFDHVIHKGRSRVEMEVSVAMLTYNLMRLVQIKGQEWVKETLKDLILLHNWHCTQYSD